VNYDVFLHVRGSRGGLQSLSSFQIKHKRMADSRTTAAIPFPSVAVCCGKAIITQRVEPLTLPLHSHVCFAHIDISTQRDTVNMLVNCMHTLHTDT